MFHRILLARLCAALLVAVAIASPSLAQSCSVTGPGGTIPSSGTGGGFYPNNPDGSEFVSSVQVPNAVTSICSVKLDGLVHTWVGDLQIVLVDPNGVGHNLMCRPGYTGFGYGSSGDFFGGLYEFVDPSTP